MTKEAVTEQVNSWLDYKKIPPLKREKYKDQVDEIVFALADGSLSLQEDMTLKQNLKFPIGKNPISALTYKPCVNIKTIQACMIGIKNNDPEGRAAGYVSALTSVHSNLIRTMDSQDFSVAKSIAVFSA